MRALWLIPDEANDIYNNYRRTIEKIVGGVTFFDIHRGFREGGAQGLEQRLRDTIQRDRPSLILFSQYADSFHLSTEFLASLARETPLVSWNGDDEIYAPRMLPFQQTCHAVISTDLFGGDRLRALGIPFYHWPFFRIHEAVSDPARPLPEDIDVSFVGNVRRRDRTAMLRALEEAGCSAKVVGAGTPRGRISNEALPSLYLRSKINLNFTKIDPDEWNARHDPARNWVRQTKGRPFEISAVGGFCLSEYAPALSAIFREGEEMAFFYDAKDLVEKVDFYLRRPEERRRMMVAARNKMREDFDPERTLGRIFREILDRGTNRKYFVLPEVPPQSRAFLLQEAEERGRRSLHLLRRGKWGLIRWNLDSILQVLRVAFTRAARR